MDPVLSIVSLLSFKNPFVLPLEKKDEANRQKLLLAGDSASDHKVGWLYGLGLGILDERVGLGSGVVPTRLCIGVAALGQASEGMYDGPLFLLLHGQALLAAFEGWVEAERSGRGGHYCWKNFLSASTLRMVDKVRSGGLVTRVVWSGADFLSSSSDRKRPCLVPTYPMSRPECRHRF